VVLVMVPHLEERSSSDVFPVFRRTVFGRKTHVISQNVERAVVAIRLLVHPVPKIMFGDEVARAWVEASGEEAASDEVDERFGAKAADEGVVEDELGQDVEEMPARQALGADKGGSEGVKEYLERSVKVCLSRMRMDTRVAH